MIKQVIILFIIYINLIGCTNMKNTNNEVLLYNTEEYKEFEKQAKVSLKEAILLVCKDSKYKPFLQHYLIYKDNYIFTSLPPTHAGTLVLSEGLLVNTDTSEVTTIDNTTFDEKKIQVEYSTAIKCKR